MASMLVLFNVNSSIVRTGVMPFVLWEGTIVSVVPAQNEARLCQLGTQSYWAASVLYVQPR